MTPAGRPVIAAIGDRNPSYFTHREIDSAIDLFPPSVEIGWRATDNLRQTGIDDVDAVWLLSGSPYRDDTAVLHVIRRCVEDSIPFLGMCGGMQYACMELLCRFGIVDRPVHAEIGGEGEIVIAPLACSLYGEKRMVVPEPGTKLAAIQGDEPFEGFHFCGFGPLRTYVDRLADHGVVVSATAEGTEVEAIELTSHPFFIGTAFQPQVGAADAGELPPLLQALVAAACARHDESRRSVSARA